MSTTTRIMMAAALSLASLGAQAQYGPPTPPRSDKAPAKRDHDPARLAPLGEYQVDTLDPIFETGRSLDEHSKHEEHSLSRQADRINQSARYYSQDRFIGNERDVRTIRDETSRAEAAARRLGTWPGK